MIRPYTVVLSQSSKSADLSVPARTLVAKFHDRMVTQSRTASSKNFDLWGFTVIMIAHNVHLGQKEILLCDHRLKILIAGKQIKKGYLGHGKNANNESADVC